MQLLSLQLVPSGECLFPLHKALALEQFTHSHNSSFVCFFSVQSLKNGMATLQLTRRGFLLYETVSMCCRLCDNMGRESIDSRIEGPRINKVLSVLTSQGCSGLNCIVGQPMYREGAGRGGGVAEGQLPFLQSPLECLEGFSCFWKGAVNLVAMTCYKLILKKEYVTPRS